MCKKQSSVSHTSTESEIITLDAGPRMDGLSALDLWDIVVEVLRSKNDTAQPNHDGVREAFRGPIPKPRPKMTKEGKRLINCQMWIMYTLAHILL